MGEINRRCQLSIRCLSIVAVLALLCRPPQLHPAPSLPALRPQRLISEDCSVSCSCLPGGSDQWEGPAGARQAARGAWGPPSPAWQWLWVFCHHIWQQMGRRQGRAGLPHPLLKEKAYWKLPARLCLHFMWGEPGYPGRPGNVVFIPGDSTWE